MLITRQKKVPLHWVFYAQLPFVMAISANMITGAPFLYAMKKFIDNPAAITFLLSIEVFVTIICGPFVSWLSDRIWTPFGRRRPFIVVAQISMAIAVVLMPFAPDLITLICLRWAYGILGDLGAPNQALTMEVVPSKQRGMGAGFFKLQGQVVNLFFFLLVVGRFDDVYFTGPLLALFAIPGETLIFAAGGILFLSVSFFTWFGIHEVEPPSHQSVRDEQKPGEPVVKLFLRTFFRDVFHKSLFPLYLLLMVGTLTSVSLGTLGPLLYTDQWGYTLQEMGTNVAIGAVIGIGAALVAGWVADKTSKMKVYTVGLVLTFLSHIVWTIFVAYKPDHRPELHEIIIFGTIGNIFGLITAAASFPLILEYVERNRLGTAGAGMGLFSATIKNGFTMFTGFFILWWSVLFLPQAGDQVQVVFQHELSAPEILQELNAAGYPTKDLEIKPVFRPGTEGEVSRQWNLRRPIDSAGDTHTEIKDINTKLSQTQLKLDRPNVTEDAKASLKAEIAALREKEAALKASLADSAKAFGAELVRVFAGRLAVDGNQIVAASTAEGGTELNLTLEFVQPVTADITPRTFLEILGLGHPATERKTVASELARTMETVDLNRVADPGSSLTKPELFVTPGTGPTNTITLRLLRDPDFVILENAILSAGVEGTAAYNLASDIILPLRGLTTQSSASYAITNPGVSRDRLGFDLRLAGSADPLEAKTIEDAFRPIKSIVGTEITGSFPDFHVELSLKPQPAAPAEATLSAAGRRLRELLPAATPAELSALENLSQRAAETAAARPVFLTVARPVVLTQPTDREYDYFFSMQYFMIFTDVLGLLIVFLIVHLEKTGRIVRLGALEDTKR